MKKQKINQPSVETKSTSESDLSFVVYTNGSAASKENIINNIAAPLARSRSEADLVIFGNVTLMEIEPQVAELLTKNRCRLQTPEAGANKEALNACKGSWIYIVDDPATFNLSQVLTCFSANKKGFIPGNIYSGRFDSGSGKLERSISSRVARTLYNFTGQLFLPSAVKDHSHRFNFFPKNIAADLWEDGYTQPQMLSFAAYHNNEVKEFSLTEKENVPIEGSVAGIVSNAFKVRWKWFVTGAIRDLKKPYEEQNHALSRLGFASFCVIGFFAMCVLSFDFGISWDARRHNTYGYQMLNYFTSMGDDTTCLAENSSINEFRYYGEHFNVIAAFFNTYAKIFGEFETRHLLNALYGLLAMLFAALCAKEIGSWRTALIAFTCIFFSPVFFGHAMNNPTDIPFAAGCAMAVYYLIKVLKTLPGPKFSHIFLCAFGIGIAIGSRIGGLVLFGYAGLFIGLHWLSIWQKQGWKTASRSLLPYLMCGIALILMGFFFGISLWPFARQEPFTNWYVALKRSTDASFFTYNHELFEGVRMYMGNVPWYYLPKFIWMNSPLFVPVGLLLVLALSFLWKKLFSNWMYIPVILFVLVFPIVYAEYQSMYYYNGWRHYLFVYPPMIVLCAIGWDAVMRLLKNRMMQYVVSAVFIGFVALPAYWMIKNHPNEVVYFNEAVGGINAAYGNYETDYYSNSVREAAEWLAHHEPDRKVLVAINNEPLTGSYYATRINPKMEFMWVREYEEQRPRWDYMILTSRTYSRNELLNGSFPPKGTVYKVMADDVPLAVVVKRENYFMPQAYECLSRKNVDSAIVFFKKAAEYNPMDEEPYRMIGTSYMEKKSFDTAAQYLSKSIEIFPENYLSYDNLGLIHLTQRQYDKALPYFSKAIELKHNNTEAYYYSAVCYYSKGDFNAGIRLLENAIKRNGAIYQTYYYLGIGYINIGQYKKAQDALSFALGYNPKSAEAYLALAEMFKKRNMQNEYQQCMQNYRALGGQ